MLQRIFKSLNRNTHGLDTSLNSDRTLEVSADDNGDEPSSLNYDSSTRVFAYGGAAVRSKIADSMLESLTSEISSLEDIEKILAEKYQISIDPVAIRHTARARAMDEIDVDAYWEWSQMHTLYHCRKELAYMQMFGHVESESPPSSAPKPPSSIDPSRFWAVIIGIDEYSSAPLRGCVSDALEIAEYLSEDLGIANDHVRLLLGAHTVSTQGFSGDNPCIPPTRNNIVNTLLGLSTDTRIKVGDSIIIYFSGHGTKYLCSEYLPYSDSHAGVGTIEALAPIDRLDGKVPDISDREINTILSEISRTKGHHITFILDCCHASTLTRAMQGKGSVRGIKGLPRAGTIADMLKAADRRLSHLPGYRSVLAENWFPNMDSHVILAGCKEYEYAMEVKYEDGYHGIFTRALTKVLKSATDEVTYVGLLEALPSTVHQTPVIAGKHRKAKLWYQDSVPEEKMETKINITSFRDNSTSGVRAG